MKSFFAPGCRIEPKVDGLYEIWFNPAAPAGERGGEAWSTFVLPNLVWRVAHGPIDWKARPEVKPVAGTLKVDLSPAP